MKNKHATIIICLVLIVLTTQIVSATWANTNCLYKRNIPILNSVSTNLQNATLFIHLNSTNYNFTDNNHNYQFYNSSESGSALNFYRAFYDKTNKEAYFYIPTKNESWGINTNITTWLYYNCTGITDLNSQTVENYGNLSITYHFDERNTNYVNDSSNAINFDLKGGSITKGIIGNATNITQASDIPYNILRHVNTTNQPFRISFWYKYIINTTSPTTDPSIFFQNSNNPAQDAGFNIGLRGDGGNPAKMTGNLYYNAGVGNCGFQLNNTNFNDSNWHFLDIKRNASYFSLKIDNGIQEANITDESQLNACVQNQVPNSQYATNRNLSIANATISVFDDFRMWKGTMGWDTFYEQNLTQEIGSEQSILLTITQQNPLNNALILFNYSTGINFTYEINTSNNYNTTLYLNNTVINSTFNLSSGTHSFFLTNLSILGQNRDFTSINWYVSATDLTNIVTTTGSNRNLSIDIIPYSAIITYFTNISEVNDSSNFSMQLQYNYSNNTIIQNAQCDLQFPQRTANGIFDSIAGLFNFSLSHWFGLQSVTANCTQTNTTSSNLVQNVNVTDKTRPLITIINGTNATQNNANNFTFAFTTTDNSTISGNLTINNTIYSYNTITKQVIANVTGDFVYSWNLSILDSNGNRNTTPNYIIIHDITTPTINAWNVPSTATANTAFNIRANITDTNTINNASFSITQPNSVVITTQLTTDTTTAGYTHSASITLSQIGINTLTQFYSSDLAGNSISNTSLGINIDTQSGDSGGGGGNGNGGGGGGGGGGSSITIISSNVSFEAKPKIISQYCFWNTDTENEPKCTTQVRTNKELTTCKIVTGTNTECTILTSNSLNIITIPTDKTNMITDINSQAELTSKNNDKTIIDINYRIITYTNLTKYFSYTTFTITILTLLIYIFKPNKTNKQLQQIIKQLKQ